MVQKGKGAFPWFGRSRTTRLIELQQRLLKNLAVTSNISKNWRKQVKTILTEAAGFTGASYLFSCLPGEENKPDMELFWAQAPSPATIKTVEGQLKRRLTDDGGFGRSPSFNLTHTIVDPGTPMPDRTAGDIELHERTFHLELPRESGIVGLGAPAGGRRDHLDQLAVDSVLTALVNVVGSVRALSAYTREVERFATRDPLTNLYNQISFWDLLEYETSRSERQQYKFSLLVIDLDDFKTINDTYGHEIGDSVLRDFSTILKAAVRSGDIAARYAGDQFTAILPVCDEGQANIVARRIIDGLRNHSYTMSTGAAIRGTVSIGVAVYPDHAKEAKDLFLLADNMLAQAKSFGKDRLSMPSEQDDVEVLKSMGEKSILILEALSHKRVVPYFQPIMNIKDSRIEAFEVLTRIVLPDRVVTAAEFIETAEGMGAIGRLDYQLFERTLAKVRETGYTGNLFINLSPKALVLTDFMPTIRKMMRDYGLDPSKLIFEITERDTVKNIKVIDKFIRELKQDGFRFAIDDFGSGYSSFQYIKTFSIDFLKVDGEFIRHMGRGCDCTERHIVTSIAALAGHLNIKTIAEYVESKDILTEVETAGIDYAQGYYIQKPSPDLSYAPASSQTNGSLPV
jgi:diguanylate cyclase (GGDEF)-like protein